MIGSISGTIKAKAALMDPGHYGRSDTSAMGRWFWEIDKVLLLLLADQRAQLLEAGQPQRLCEILVDLGLAGELHGLDRNREHRGLALQFVRLIILRKGDADVALIAEGPLGGTCVNVGCVPKKLLVYGAHFAEDFEQSSGFGWSLGEADFDWATLIANKDREINRLNGIYRNLLVNSGVTLHEAHAKIVGPHEVEVNGERYTAKNILIATGGWPQIPEIPGHEHAISSNEVFHLDKIPRRIVIVGGGARST